MTDFNLPHLYLAPCCGVPLEFRRDFWHKNGFSGISCGVVCVIFLV